ERLVAAGVAVHMLPVDVSAEEAMAAIDAVYAAHKPRYLFLMSGRDEGNAPLLDQAAWQRRRAQGLVNPFLTAQQWFRLRMRAKDTTPITVVAATSLGGDLGLSGQVTTPDGGSLTGLIKSLYIEDTRKPKREVRAKAIDASADEPAAAVVEAIFRELAADAPDVEVAWSRGVRRIVRSVLRPVESLPRHEVPRGGTWVATGGARGITAAVALALGQRFGAKLHLIGRSEVPQEDAPWRHSTDDQLDEMKVQIVRRAIAEGRSPDREWERIKCDIEIYRSLQKFAAAGVQATYHSCDLADWQQLAKVLAEIRRVDGPIDGIVHGAGFADSGRFGTRTREKLERTFAGKLDGAVGLMSLTRQDPVRYFVGFGSISGRFGGNGLADYAAANDMLAKLIDWYRSTRPDCASSCLHWQSWDEVGMAMLGDSNVGTKGILKMEFISPREGIDHLCRELEASLPTAEVLITDGFFERTFYPFTVAAPAATGSIDIAQLPLVDSIRPREGQPGSEAEIRFDPTTDPFLLDHKLRGKPFLAAVVGLESQAEAAALASGKTVAEVRNAQMVDGLAFRNEQPIIAHVTAVPQADGTVECELIADFHNRIGKLMHKDRIYQRATVAVVDKFVPYTAEMPEPPTEWVPFEFTNSLQMYHGPTLQGMKALSLGEEGGWAQLVALPLRAFGGARAGQEWIIPATVLDAAFYACGTHAFVFGGDAVSLPHSLELVRRGRMPRDNEKCLVQFRCRAMEAQHAIYDFTIFGEDRAVIVAVEGHRVVMLRQN
ncbi:MAG TPA: SDR family oxidoreductase, partial [Pirellulales bacterium]